MKNSSFIQSTLLILLVSVVFAACKKDKEPAPVQKQVESNGLTKDINELMPPNILEEMENLGMPINRGGNPPLVSGAFLASKFVLMNSNRQGDFIGFKYPDYKVEFSEFSSLNLSIKMNYINGFERGKEMGAFIVGEGNRFSVFAETQTEKESEIAHFAYVISGRIIQDTIIDMHVANFMLDNNDNPNEIWIEVGEGRVLMDFDGVSEPIPSFLQNL